MAAFAVLFVVVVFIADGPTYRTPKRPPSYIFPAGASGQSDVNKPFSR